MRISLPLSVVIPRKTKKDRKCILNLNNYRNWHYIVSNDIKRRYKEQVEAELHGMRLKTPITLEFTYYKPTARRSDRSNVLSIVEKFFCDALVECGCIPDDCDEYIESCHYYGGSLDRDNPRVDVVILEKI